MEGKLYVCGTPIGNLEDMSNRALRILKEVSVIACEDTRHTLKLLNYFDIKGSLTSYHEHNKEEKGRKILDILKSGRDVALVSDAGMPGISDPGYDLIKMMYDNDIEVTVIPSGTAVTSAIVLSGIQSRRFIFEGFLPQNKKSRKDILNSMKEETRTVVIYEAPHHLKGTLKELYEALGEREVALVREITKKFEEVRRDQLSGHIEYFEDNNPKGEYVIVIEGASSEEIEKKESEKWNKISIEDHLNIYEERGLKKNEAIKAVAKDRNVSKSTIYNSVMKK